LKNNHLKAFLQIIKDFNLKYDLHPEVRSLRTKDFKPDLPGDGPRSFPKKNNGQLLSFVEGRVQKAGFCPSLINQTIVRL